MILEILDTVGTVVEALLLIVAGASILAAYTPTKKDDIFLSRVKKFLNLLAFNFKHAKNKEDEDEGSK